MKQLLIKPCWQFELGLIQHRFQRFFMLLITAFLFIPQIAEAATIVGPTSACQGDKPLYSITATSTYTYEWSVDSKGSMLITKTVGGKSEGTIEWMVPGSSTITVIVKNGTSVVETLYHYVEVLPRPQPLITWDVEVGCQIEIVDPETLLPEGTDIEPAPCTKVCENSTVTYSTPNVTGSTYTWIVSGGTATPSGNTCTVVWGAFGGGMIEVIETSAGGCVGSKAICIDIIKSPRADFQVMADPTVVAPFPLNVCLFDKIVFKDLSIDNGGTELVSWFWDFGDGTTSSEKDPTHIFTTAGSYRVKLTVKNACNCTSEYELNIIVDEHAGVKIICPSVVCENSIVKYSVIDPCTPYDWDVIGGTIITPGPPPYPSEIEIEWDAVGDDGYGYVIFDGTGCTVDCPSKTAIKVPVIKAVGTITGKTTICTDKQYRYTLPQWPATDYNWSVTAGGTGAVVIPSDQPNEVIVQGTSAGTITLTCNYSNNLLLSCTGTASLVITLEAPPTITGSRLLCEGESSNYELSTLAAANWRLEGPEGSITYGTYTNFPHSFLLPGTYRLWAEGAFCWPEPIIVVVEPLPSVPDKITGQAEICAGVPYEYSAESSEAESIFEWSVSPAFSGTFNTTFGSVVSFTGDPLFTDWTISVRRVGKKAPMCAGPWLDKELTTNLTTPAITGKLDPCEFTYQTYSEAITNGEYYKWTIEPVEAGSVVANIHSSNPTILWNQRHVPSLGICTLKVEITKCNSIINDEIEIDVQTFSEVTPVVDFESNYCIDEFVDPRLVITTDLKGGTLVIEDWGDNSLDFSAPHQYKTAGSYTIEGKIVNPNGCIGDYTFSIGITIDPLPELVLSGGGTRCTDVTTTEFITASYPACTTCTVSYKNLVTSATGSAIGTATVPISPFSGPGEYLYEFTITDGGCSTTKIYGIWVLDCPPACTAVDATVISNTSELTDPKFDIDATSKEFVFDCQGMNSFPFTEGASTTYPGSSPNIWTVSDVSASATEDKTGSPFIIGFAIDKTKVGKHRFDLETRYYKTGDFPNLCPDHQTFYGIVLEYTTIKNTITCAGSTYSLASEGITKRFTGVGVPTYTNWKVTNLSAGPVIYGPSSTAPATVSLPPSSNFKVEVTTTVTYDGNPYICTYEATFSTPALPVANFNVEYTPTCDGTPVKFVSTSTPDPVTLTHFWNFGDGTTNFNPERTYTFTGITVPKPNSAFLTVTDDYGCSNISAIQNVEVFPNLLEGIISASPTLACPDEMVTLSYTSTFGSPTSYTWIRDLNTRMATTTGASYNVAYPKPGHYWVETRDANRCIGKSDDPVVVNVTGVPDVVISGKHDVCVDEPFVLNAYAGTGIVSYVWELYDAGTSTWNIVTDGTAPDYDWSESISTAGTYTYRVTIQVLKIAPSSYCFKTSAEFTVEVHDLPATPTIGFNMIACASYQVDLTATSASTGVYNWSNGMSGSPISVNEGGAYRVILTDPFGCTAEAQTDIPKNPKGYLWIFPSGCYQLCPDPDFTLRGPIIPFAAWQWRKNYVADAAGSGFVNPYTFSTAGTYNLYLDNGLCDATSEEMNFDVQCDNDSCAQNLILSAPTVSYINPTCRATISFTATYWGTGGPVSYSISSSMGGFVTMVGSPPVLSYGAPTPLNAMWTAPSPTGYPSGTLVEFIITIYLPGGGTCTKKISVPLNCPYGDVLFRETETDSLSIGKIQGLSSLALAPNPAQDKTKVSYAFGTDVPAAERYLAVYDMVGRRLVKVPVDKTEGQLDIHFGEWSSGLYQVVLLSGDKVVQTTPLSISR